MKSRPVSDTSFLIGGALLGAAAMYFLDPETGNRRRRRVAAATEGAYDHARDAVGEHLHGVSGRLKNLAHAVTDHITEARHHAGVSSQALADEARKIAAQLTDQALGVAHEKQASAEEYGHHLSDVGHRLWDKARGFGARLSHLGDSVAGQAHDVRDDLSSRAGEWGNWLSNRASTARSRARALLGHEEEHHGIGAMTAISTAVGCWAVGAGVMYFMDPLHGRKRRNQVWKQTSDAVTSAGRLMRATGNDLAQRVREAAGGQLVGAQRGVDSRRLLDDIRGRIGHVVANPNDIQFLTDSDGSVTVTGTVTRDELAALLTRVHDVPGVSHIINRVTIRENSVAPVGR